MSDIEIYEVGPRDGLQNSEFSLTTAEKIRMITELHRGGLKNIEIASFVHPKRVPNMSDAEDVFLETKHLGDFDVLIPNQRGFDRAKAVGVNNFNVFFSPSDEFNLRNLGRTLDMAYPDIKNMLEDENRDNVRAYISCAFGCPFEGMPKENKMREVLKMADEIATEVVLCDTIGSSYPTKMVQTLEMTRRLDADVALHLHQRKNETSNVFANVEAAVEWGVTKFDASIAGLGGCPFIPQSGSNLSTNQLINWAHNSGHETGIELEDLWNVTDWMLHKNREIEMVV